MLDTATKRRIDTARDILVGKVPDPKSQVEQITIALIYKFMDDMDAESEEVGGERSFFANGFAQYSWAKLMRSGLGGHETLNLYAEAIAKMPENPGIPPLFRSIFKHAFLPYRDPETLKSFLKVIDEFEYDHSERLGDAFEYLLSVLGSQGDAGQFRTPRHIIDFMVKVIDPKKHEKILDPACGTAGFLISSFKHIRDANNHSPLTPDEKGMLAANIKGYDISPDMVRLSLVNLYLHGFNDPHIEEYDTLTSQEKWNEYADVILANPPFMSPKGGIKPHTRFTVQSKRSEVLFVDYMAEHLTPNGRAAIIVPEGIIFQSGTAYKQLRKMLVESSLVAVISLPAGVFQPYSGVKTSVLILDKSLARQSKSIGFFKVENDGFGLGAQRRPIEKNDLPAVLSEIDQFMFALRKWHSADDLSFSMGLSVAKERIAENEEYNLSGERYRESIAGNHQYQLVRIGDICTINPSKKTINEISDDTLVSFVPMADIGEHRMIFTPRETKRLSEVSASYTYFENDDVLLAKVTPCFENGKAGIARELLNGIGFGSSEYYVLRCSQTVLPEWLYFCITHPVFRNPAISQMTGTGGLQRVPRKFVEDFRIPLPPLDIQKEIVAEIEGYQKVIDGARAVVDNYKPHIPIDPEWELVRLGDVLRKSDESIMPESLSESVVYIGLENISQATGQLCGNIISNNPSDIKSLKSVFSVGNILYGKLRPNLNKVWLANCAGICSTDIFVLEPANADVLTSFYAIILRSESFNASVISHIKGAQLPRVGWSSFASIQIPFPAIEIQQTIAAEIQSEQALVNANRELIGRFEKKIQKTIARVWGEDESFTING
jgi:type I restriction enzyme M protein